MRLVLVLYLGSVAFLVKGSIYAIRAHGMLQGMRVTPELALRIQGMSDVDAAREQLIWRVWEYYQVLPVTTHRLFNTHRAARNLTMSILSFTITGLLLLASGHSSGRSATCLLMLVDVVVLLAVFGVDPLWERFGGLWSE